MAWSASEYFGPYLWQHFSFFKTYDNTAVLSESIYPSNGRPFKITEIRLHLSVAMGSDKYFQVILSSVKGSAYNVTLISLNYKTSTDHIWYFSDISAPLVFLSGDTVNVLTSQLSTANVHGLQVNGWAVMGRD